MIVKDITAGKKYIAKSGEEKIKWTNVGSLFIRDDGKMVVKINEYINPLAFANEKGEVWFNVFDKDNKEGNSKNYNHGGEYKDDNSERVMAEGRSYAEKWRKQTEGELIGDIADDGTIIVDGKPLL